MKNWYKNKIYKIDNNHRMYTSNCYYNKGLPTWQIQKNLKTNITDENGKKGEKRKYQEFKRLCKLR